MRWILCTVAVAGCTESPSAIECLPEGRTLADLHLASSEIDVNPGVTFPLGVYAGDDEAGGDNITACASPVWSVAGNGDVTIDDTGEVTVPASAALGERHIVTAHVPGTDVDLRTDIWTYTRESHPQVGRWHEVERYSCADGSVLPTTRQVSQLDVYVTGGTAVTWEPVEGGSYDYAVAIAYSGTTMTLVSASGLTIPSDADFDGTFDTTGGDLVMRDVYLGTYRYSSDPASELACGHRFAL